MKFTDNGAEQTHALLKSSICKQADLESEAFLEIESELQSRKWLQIYNDINHIDYDVYKILHRKSWEFSYITLALRERGMLREGKQGLGFAVGIEPLPSFFASKGCKILATDLGIDSEDALRWAQSGQNAVGNINQLNILHHCPDDVFQKNVHYRGLDMNNIPRELNEQFDFCWSSCAIEHVGSLEKSKQFLKNMIKVLRPGGIAVHTTEFNLSSDTRTIDQGDSVIYRKCDILEIAEWMVREGHEMAELDFSLGTQEGDCFVDMPPYFRPPAHYHLRLQLSYVRPTNRFRNKLLDMTFGKGVRFIKRNLGRPVVESFTSTSIGLIFRKKDYRNQSPE